MIPILFKDIRDIDLYVNCIQLFNFVFLYKYFIKIKNLFINLF